MFYPKISLLMDQGRFDLAEAAIREEMRESIDDAFLFVLLSTALIRQNRPKEGEEAARRAVELEPDNDVTHFSVARALLERNRHREALIATNEAIRLDPEDADYHGIKARILAEQAELERALEAAEAGLALDPDNETCRVYRTLILGKLGRHDDADSESLGLLADSPEDSYHHSARGWILAEVNDADRAQLHFAEALRLDATNEDARLGLAHVLKLKNPLLGWMLRLLVLLGRIPIWPLLGGVLILLALSDRLDEMSAPFPLVSAAIRVAFYVVFLTALVVNPLFNLVLRFSRIGRNALSDDERRSVRWCAVPLVIGLFFLASWIFKGAKFMPLHAIAWLSAARMIAEVFETRNRWVRQWLTAAAILTCAVAVWIEIATFGIILPQLMEIISTMATDPEAPLEGAVKEHFLAIMRMRRHLIDYPVLAIYFLAIFSDNLREWLHQWAPDAEV